MENSHLTHNLLQQLKETESSIKTYLESVGGDVNYCTEEEYEQITQLQNNLSIILDSITTKI